MAESSPYYELWENQSGNLLADFDTVEAALRFVRGALKEGGRVEVLSWSLHRSDMATPVAYGKALRALANKRTPI